MVSPGTLSSEPKKIKRFPHHRLAHQPVDLREGVAKAYSVVKEVSAYLGARAGTGWPTFLAFVGRAFCGWKPLRVDLELLPIASASVCTRSEKRAR